MVHGWGCNPHRSLWRHNSETMRDREKRRPPRPMKSYELSNGGNRIALQQLLQNGKWRHLWYHNLGSRRKLQKMTRENFSIGAFYNITNKSSAVAEMGDRGHNRHGPKRGGCAVPLSCSAGIPSNKMWPAPRSTSVPTGIFIHPAVWPQ